MPLRSGVWRLSIKRQEGQGRWWGVRPIEFRSQDLRRELKLAVPFLHRVRFCIPSHFYCKVSFLEFGYQFRMIPQDRSRNSRGAKAEMLGTKTQHGLRQKLSCHLKPALSWRSKKGIMLNEVQSGVLILLKKFSCDGERKRSWVWLRNQT